MFRSRDARRAGELSSRPQPGERDQAIFSRRKRHARPICALAMMIGCAVSGNVAAQPAGEESLEQMLQRLGLVELQMHQLERAIATTRPGRERQEQARRLADLYASELMQHTDEPERYADLMRRIERLIEQVPQASTASLQVMLLQADFNRAEGRIGQWTADPSDIASRDEARQVLNRIAPVLDQFQQQLMEESQALAARADEETNDAVRERLDQELSRRQALAARAAYFAGWSRYYLGLVQRAGDRDADATASFERAREILARLLGIEETDLAEVDAGWLGLHSVWRCRAVVGLGLAESALGRLDNAARCFAWLEDASAPPDIRDQAAYWHLQGLVNAGQWEAARELARAHLEDFSGSATQGRVTFCVTLVRAGFGSESPHPELGRLGLNGLARLGELAAIRSLVEQYEIAVGADVGIVLQWAHAENLYHAAVDSQQPEDYRAAIDAYARALDAPDAASQVTLVGLCHYYQAWCHYELEEYAAAAGHFEQAVAGLKAGRDERAPEANWMAFVAYHRLGTDTPRWSTAAIEALQNLQRDFPGHRYAEQARLQLARLINAGNPAEFVRQLERVSPDDPNYPAARYELCVLLHQLWLQSQEGAAEQSTYSTRLREAARTALELTALEPRRRLRCALLAADAALESEGTQPEDFLEAAARLIDAVDPADSLVGEYHYARMRLAGMRSDETARIREAEWIVEHAPGSAYEIPALIVVAREADRRVDASGEPLPDDLGAAYEAYARLSAALGRDQNTLTTRRNARVALLRQGRYALDLGRAQEAASTFDRLLQAYPQEKAYLRYSGLAWYQAGEPQRALPRWRTLVSGLSSGDEDWYEAKYYQLRCLLAVDADQARRVWRQFRLLHPEVRGPWKDRFADLADSFEG